MSINNPWLTPFQRSFQSIKAKLMDTLRIRVPEITDFSEGNIFTIIISMFSAIAEVIHYYIDNVSREAFFMTARRYSSLRLHAKFFDYHVKSAIPSRTDILLSLDTGETPNVGINIPAGTKFTSSGGVEFISIKPIVWSKNSLGAYIPVIQLEKVEGLNFGTVTYTNNIYLTLGDLEEGKLYAEGTMVLYITKDGVTEPWELVETFAYSKATDKHFKVEVDNNQEPFIVFGNGIFGMKPQVGSTLTGDIYVTRGVAGMVLAESITTVPSSIASQHNNIICSNPMPSTGASNYEDFNMLKYHVPLSIRTLGVAITSRDYGDLVKLIPGVDKALVTEECGRYLKIYITPDGGGTASESLISYVKSELLKKKILATVFEVYATDESRVYIEAEVTGRPSFKSEDIELQVTNALTSSYDYNTSDISKPVRLSDIYALIDNLSMVDYVNIKNLYIKPYPTKVGQTQTELNWDIKIDNIANKIDLLVRYNSTDGKMHLLNSEFEELNISLQPDGGWLDITLGVNKFSIRIYQPLVGDYGNAELWKITLQRNHGDQIPTENSIPIFKGSNDIVLKIVES